MKTITDRKNNLTIRTYDYSEVDLPALDDTVEITHYEKNGLIGIRHKSSYSEKLISCDDIDALVKALTATEQSTKTSKGKVSKSAIAENKPCDYSDISVVERADGNGDKAPKTADFNVFDVDPDTGEVIELSRDYEGLRRSWRRQCEYTKNSACWSLIRFFTCTLDTKPTYEQLNRVIGSFCKWLVRNYKDMMDNCFIFCEPCEDGSWHAHFLIAFIADEPSEFKDNTKKWWARYNTQPCDEQVVFSDNFKSVDDLLRVLDYLNPTSKDKRGRIKYYPHGCQPMRHIGNVTAPTKALAKFEVAKKMVGDEKPERRSAVEVEQTDTGVMLYSCQEYLFTAKTILFEQTNYTAIAADSNRGDKRSKCVHLQKCHIKKSRSCEHCPFFKAAEENNTTSDGGKVDYFRCKDGECDKCANQSSCNKYGRCDYCFAYDTSFCRGCKYDYSFIINAF